MKKAPVPPLFIDCDPEELKNMVLLFATSVPVFVQLPLTVKSFVPVIVSVAPVFIVMLLQTAPVAPMVGENGAPEEIVTLSVAVGTAPPHS
jgi:hypothetical protein